MICQLTQLTTLADDSSKVISHRVNRMMSGRMTNAEAFEMISEKVLAFQLATFAALTGCDPLVPYQDRVAQNLNRLEKEAL